MRKYDSESKVEQIALKVSDKKNCYSPTEKINVIEVADFPSLGKLTALRFLEWLQKNPEGVVSLPTGKTPEYFIKWTNYFLENWNDKKIQKELIDWGLVPTKKPKMSSFYFVQIDEFYPMNPEHENSFAHYIDRFYFKQFGFDPKKALLMDTWKTGAIKNKNLGDIFGANKVDLNLRFCKPKSELEKQKQDAIVAMDQFATEYEEKIKKLGDIGFFLGGIGPDGHIGFNIEGSDHFSTTRLTPINYETAAVAAGDLGGIEISRNKLVVTIGLKTITQNKTTTAITIAAGESKAKVVKNAIESAPSNFYPATALQKLPASCFYLTKGAASLLTERHLKKTSKDLKTDLLQKINKGLDDFIGSTFLHTAPHHDDIMLGYLPYMVHLVRNSESQHYFATMTSGFTAVTNDYALNQIQNLKNFIETSVLDNVVQKGCLSSKCSNMSCCSMSGKSKDVYRYLDGVAANSVEMQKRAEACRMFRDFLEFFNIEIQSKKDITRIEKEIEKLELYFDKTYPGKKDSEVVQKLKGMIREWEEELLWGHLGFNCDHIFHLRLGFYTGDIFTQQPEFERDVKPILNLLEKLNPDILTVALDPEGTGPDTHYKVLQATSQALETYLQKKPNKKIQVWGYRNVWYRFQPEESNIFVPVSMNSFAILRESFNTCFASQRSASFPSYEYDGPFSELAQKVMVEQYEDLREILGEDYFYKNPIPRLRATRGFCFLKSMTPEEFFVEADLLKKRMENC